MNSRFARASMVTVILLIVLAPLYWLMAASFKSNQEITQGRTLYPHAPTFDNYIRLFQQKEFASYLTNSLVVTISSVTIALVLGTLGAYAIARFRLPFMLERKAVFFLLTMRIVPPVVILIPVFLLMLKLNLLDSWLGLIITYTTFNITFCVWMMESFFREIPVDLEEVAMVDGNSRFAAFYRITLPLVAPGLAATAIFAVITTVNEFMFSLVLTATPHAMTMPRGTATLIGRVDMDWGSMAAAGIVGALPVVIFALLVQRHLVRGLTMGAVK
ncbi:carbohydrate ABC transporter permease [Rhizobium lentis]|uniref:carbohydrate ABC transporter permease n=1 Tax=Rhizobium lentis TaxID=1138194 RepID=UPI001C837CA0|nr:carbohydrate ABC transporter permease [Rhizobium lentis]MBX5180011.1 carbohydrate ABC transporter permease [Rhizobium lentis]